MTAGLRASGRPAPRWPKTRPAPGRPRTSSAPDPPCHDGKLPRPESLQRPIPPRAARRRDLGAIRAHRVTGEMTGGLKDAGIPAAVGGAAGGESRVPDVHTLPAPVRGVVEHAYGAATDDLFPAATPFALLAPVAVVLLKEKPLKTTSGMERLAQESRAPAADATAPAQRPGGVPAGHGQRSRGAGRLSPGTREDTPTPNGAARHGRRAAPSASPDVRRPPAARRGPSWSPGTGRGGRTPGSPRRCVALNERHVNAVRTARGPGPRGGGLVLTKDEGRPMVADK